jgi:AraC family transcriptional regulator
MQWMRMPEIDTVVQCEKTQAIRQFMRGKSHRLFSSKGLGWTGLLLEKHELSAGEWPASELSGLVLCLWDTAGRCDHLDANGNFVPKLIHSGTLSLYTAGVLPEVRPSIPSSGLICAFDADFQMEVPEEIRGESNIRSVADGVIAQDKRCFTDLPLQRTLEALGEEARSGGRFGRLYADELIQCLCDRLLDLTQTCGRGAWLKYKMDTRTLLQLSDRIEATPEANLDLETLAAESGCSKRHLLRSFRASTGRTPHQYILDLRIEKAKRLMLKPFLSLIDIALECGFASQAHFTYAFRQRLGVPPSAFRRRF